MITQKSLALSIFFIACNTQKVVEDAQCSDAEQDMFMTCVSAGCSASYSQDLAGADSCKVEGGGSVVSVEAGGECGFTSSGSCYVVCDCPDGVSVKMNVETENGQATTDNQQSSEVTDAAVSLIMEKISLFESMINELSAAVLLSEEKDREIQDSVSEIESRLESKIDALVAIQEEEVSRLQNEIASLRNEILALELSNQRAQDDASQALSEIRALDARITNIENVQLSLSEDVLSLYDSVGLQLSRYEVDCNMNNLASAQHIPVGTSWIEDRKCVLVEDVNADDMPVISITQVKTSWATECSDYYSRTGSYSCPISWSTEFQQGIYDGGLVQYGINDILGTGSAFRFDALTQEIYTAGHYKRSSTDLTPNIYIVTVVGNQSFTSPY